MSNDESVVRRHFPGVMVSSTFTDLERHRDTLISALLRQKLHPIAMENYELIPDDDIISSSLRMVAESSAYVGLISHRYGQIIEDAERNPDAYSVSRLEYEEAQRLGLPTLIFIMGDKHEGVKGDFETDPLKEKKLQEYRARVKTGAKGPRLYAQFDSLEQFKERAIHAVANLRKHLEDAPKARPAERETEAPPVAPPRSPSLHDEVASAEEISTVEAFLEQRWTLTQLIEAITAQPDARSKLIIALQDGTWRRYLAAYIASKIEIPAADLIAIGFNHQHSWGPRCAILTLLRFTPPSKMRDARAALVEAGEREASMDSLRLTILGLGYLDGQNEVYRIIKDEGVFDLGYPNEKLGSYAALAYLHCYIGAKTEREESEALRAFTQITEANKRHGHDNFVFFDYADEFQTIRPGKAVALFRHLRDHQHDRALSALLARLSERPNPRLATELIRLGSNASDKDVAAGALHAAAYIGEPKVVSALQEASTANHPGAQAALLLAYGVCPAEADKVALEAALHGGEKDAAWLNDCRGNALWSIGEVGRDDPSFTRRILSAVRDDPESAYERGLAALGLAKAGEVLSTAELDSALDTATSFYERMLVAIGAALGGSPRAIAIGIRGMIENAGPPFRLLAHIQRDLRCALEKHAGEGGKALVTLWDLGDFN